VVVFLGEKMKDFFFTDNLGITLKDDGDTVKIKIKDIATGGMLTIHLNEENTQRVKKFFEKVKTNEEDEN
jgi:hypothetical protein